MSSSFLSPPNSSALSDRIIGGVVERVGPLRNRLGLTDESDNREAARYTKPREAFSYLDVESYSPGVMNKLPPRTNVGHKQPPSLDSLASTATTHGTPAYPVEPEELGVATGRKPRVSASRRERCRINQARYRKRQRKYAENLDEGIRTLQLEIQDLETKRQNILRCAPTNESVWVVATEYFRLFRYGYMTPVMEPETSSTTTDGQPIRRPQQAHAQLDFLRATMAPDVTDGVVCGAETLLENWKLVSLCCGDVHVQLKRLEQGAADSLLALTATSVTITETTLRQVFPHLVVTRDSEEGAESERSPLAAKLLDERLTVRGSVRFDWDPSTGRVTRHESKADLLTTMLQLLGSLEDVATVFDKALVTPEGKFIK